VKAPPRLSRDLRGIVHVGHPVIGTICLEDEGTESPGPPTCLWCVAGKTPKLFETTLSIDIRTRGETSK